MHTMLLSGSAPDAYVCTAVSGWSRQLIRGGRESPGMTARLVDADPMEGRIVRFADLRQNGTPVMFIDSVLPGHYRMNYSVVGDTASENPDFRSMLAAPHR